MTRLQSALVLNLITYSHNRALHVIYANRGCYKLIETIFDLVITNATLITLLHFVTLGHFEHSVVLLTNEIQGTSGSHMINRFSQIKDCLNEFITTTICINYM